jgi:hypothetical protein
LQNHIAQIAGAKKPHRPSAPSKPMPPAAKLPTAAATSLFPMSLSTAFFSAAVETSVAFV